MSAILEGLEDFTGPVIDLVDEVVDRLSAEWQAKHPGEAMDDDTFSRIAAKADRLVVTRLL